MFNCKIVIGSWGSYNEGNERSMGSQWLDLNDFDSWDEICEELEHEGFELYGIDEELFIQDIESDIEGFNCDYMHPADYFNLLKIAGLFENDYKADVASAYIETQGFRYWADLVQDRGDRWDDDVIFWRGMDMVDVAIELVAESYNLPKIAERYFDYEAFARDLSFDGFFEAENGVIQIY